MTSLFAWLRRPTRGAHSAVVALSMAMIVSAARAQQPLPDFSPILVGAGSINTIVRQADGGFVIGGSFESVNGVPRRNLARLRPDGTLDPSWDPSPNSSVRAIALAADGSVYVGGGFSSIGGQLRSRLAKLSPTGTGVADASWNPGASNDPLSIRVAPDGAVFVGGSFSTIGGQSRQGVARLAGGGSGAADPAWNAAVNGSVTTLALNANGLYMIGSFTSVGAQARNRIAKVAVATGSVDAAWNPAPNSTVLALALNAAGDVYAGGGFTTIGGQSRTRVAKLAGTGTGAADASWNPVATNTVTYLATDPAGAVYVEGLFNSIGGAQRRFFARLSGSGTGIADASFAPGGDGRVNAIAFRPDGSLLIGGDFAFVNNSSRPGLANLTSTGTLGAAPPQIDTNAVTVQCLARQSDGALILGGNFHRIGSTPRSAIARLRADGTLDPTWNPGADGAVRALAIDASGAVYAGGEFATIGGQPRSRIAKLAPGASGAADAAWNPGADDTVTSLRIDASGRVYAAGEFATLGGASRTRVGRITASGTVDAGWGPTSVGGSIDAVAVDGTGVYVGGNFQTIGGQSRRNLAKLSIAATGAVDTSWNPDVEGLVSALALDGAGRLVVGGLFTAVGGAVRENLARVATVGAGAVDPSFAPQANASVFALAFDVDGSLFAGGVFNTVDALSISRVAKFAPNGTLDPNWRPQPTGNVLALLPDGQGAVDLAGAFRTVGSEPRTGYARVRSFYRLEYSADANGTIAGTTSQRVAHGADATAVTATAATGFRFGAWSDGSTQNPRQDLDVVADLGVTAQFMNTAPSIATVIASPATLFEAEASTISVGASDAESGALVYRFDCDGNGSFEIGPQSAASTSCPFASPGTRRVAVRVTDGPGLSSQSFVDVTVNDSLPVATIDLPERIDEDAPLPLAIDASVPSSGESIAAIEVDCDFDGAQFDLDLSSSFPAPALACAGSPVGGIARRIGVRARDDGLENGPIVSALVTVIAINDPPQFVPGADVASNEDAAVSLEAWATSIAPGPVEAGDEAAQSLQFEVLSNSAPSLFAGGPTFDAQGRLSFLPTPEASGIAQVKLRLCDDGASAAPDANCSAALEFLIEIAAVNDAPSLQLGAVPREAAGSTGARNVTGFAQFDAGPDDEDASQQVDAYLVDAVLDPDGVLQPASLAIADDGTLTYVLTGASGNAAIAVRVRDDGGTARGGSDTSATKLFTVTVGAAADLQVMLDNGATRLVDGETTLYALVIANAGPNAVSGATLTDVFPSTLVDVQWTCSSTISTGTCPPAAAGDDDIALDFDLAVGALLRFDVIARVDADAGNAAIHIAEVALPDGVSAIDASNDRAIDQDPILRQGIFGHGFESPASPPSSVTGVRAALEDR